MNTRSESVGEWEWVSIEMWRFALTAESVA